MGLFGKSKRRPKSDPSPSQPPPENPPPPPSPAEAEANYNNGGYLNNSYSYNDYDNYFSSNPQPWPFDHRVPDHRRGPPQGEFVPPPPHYGYPNAEDRYYVYPPAPSWTPGPVDPPPPPPPPQTYFMPPPGRSSDEDPNAQCFIM